MTFADRLRQTREGAGLTQAGLGAQIGKPKQNVWDWETGRTQPSLDTITKLAEALNMAPGWLAFGVPDLREAIRKLADEFEDGRVAVYDGGEIRISKPPGRAVAQRLRAVAGSG